jgi:hypothetical protein
MAKLLVPVNSSDNAIRALQYAIGVAKANPSTELHIVNALEPPIVSGEIAVYHPRRRLGSCSAGTARIP